VTRFLRDESGATAVELGVLVALIAMTIMALMSTTSNNIGISFGKISDMLQQSNDKVGT
jgi:pilus assembly protein Flp/PilA